MNCTRIQRQLGESELDRLPGAVRTHLKQCASCRAVYADMQKIRGLLSLKTYEQPDPDTERRILNGIHRRILDHESIQEKATGRWPVFQEVFFPVLRYGVAALFVMLLAAHILFVSNLPGVGTVSWPGGEKPRRLTAVAPGPTNRTMSPLLDGTESIVRVASNGAPSTIQYGPLPSSLVDFQF